MKFLWLAWRINVLKGFLVLSKLSNCVGWGLRDLKCLSVKKDKYEVWLWHNSITYMSNNMTDLCNVMQISVFYLNAKDHSGNGPKCFSLLASNVVWSHVLSLIARQWSCNQWSLVKSILWWCWWRCCGWGWRWRWCGQWSMGAVQEHILP